MAAKPAILFEETTTVVEQMAWPTDWAALFGREAPLILEIGFGGGGFLVDLAQRRPDANIIGLEISRPALQKVALKLHKRGMEHVRLVQGGGLQLLWCCLAPDSLAEIYVNFSDPWPKHVDRRLVDDRFLRLAASRLAPAGQLDIATDHADYAEQITGCLGRASFLRSRLAAPFVTSDPGRHQTKYELKGLAEGRTCHYYKYEKVASPPVAEFAIPEEYEMPHIILQTTLTLPQVKAQFSPFHQPAGPEGHIRFMQLFENVRDQSLLVETHVGEVAVTQHLGLSIRQRTPGELILGLADFGFPRPTLGTHVAIQYLADWLMTLDPAGAIIQSNLRSLAST